MCPCVCVRVGQVEEEQSRAEVWRGRSASGWCTSPSPGPRLEPGWFPGSHSLGAGRWAGGRAWSWSREELMINARQALWANLSPPARGAGRKCGRKQGVVAAAVRTAALWAAGRPGCRDSPRGQPGGAGSRHRVPAVLPPTPPGGERRLSSGSRYGGRWAGRGRCWPRSRVLPHTVGSKNGLSTLDFSKPFLLCWDRGSRAVAWGARRSGSRLADGSRDSGTLAQPGFCELA